MSREQIADKQMTFSKDLAGSRLRLKFSLLPAICLISVVCLVGSLLQKRAPEIALRALLVATETSRA